MDKLDDLAKQIATQPAALRAGLIALQDVVRCLRETGNYSDEEGDATDKLDDLAKQIATQPAALPAQPIPAFDAAMLALEAACRDKYPQWDNPQFFGEMAKQLRRQEIAGLLAAQGGVK